MEPNYTVDRWLGRREAFAAIAGRCSAANVQCLKEVRDQKLYESHAPTWDEFCTQHVGMSKRYVNRLIDNLEEFGSVYFELSQLTRVSPKTFRAIASHVTSEGVCCNGEVIALLPENAPKITAAVASLRKNEETGRPGFPTIARRGEELIEMVEELETCEPADQKSLAELIFRLCRAAAKAGVEVTAG
jgi:hypothetical protein